MKHNIKFLLSIFTIIAIITACYSTPTQHRVGEKNKISTKNYYFENDISVAYEKGDCYGLGSWDAFFEFEFLKRGNYNVSFIPSPVNRDQYPDDFTIKVTSKEPILMKKYKKVNCTALVVKISITFQAIDSTNKIDTTKKALSEAHDFWDPNTGR